MKKKNNTHSLTLHHLLLYTTLTLATLWNESGWGQTILINEPFTSSLNGWNTNIGSGDNIAVSNTNSAGGTAYEAKFTGNSMGSIITDRLYYGPINTSGYTSLTLQWNNYMDYYSSSYAYSMTVQTSSDGSTWHNTTWVTNPVTADLGPGLQSITISTSDVGSSTFFIAFTLNGYTFGMNYWYIDNVLLQGISSCAAPTSAATTNITSSGATANWSGGTGNYIVEYGASGFTPGTGASAGTGGTIINVSAGNTNTAITGLTSGTSYNYYIRQVCSGPTYSSNSLVQSFTTTCTALSGTKTIGASGCDYTTITVAVNALNSCGVSGPVVFLLKDATYSTSETFPITINALTGASTTNTITFKPYTGITSTISGSVSSGALIKLNSSKYITFDGSNSGGTDKNLTIQNTSTTSPNTLWIGGTASAIAQNDVIKNCIFINGINSSSAIVISDATTSGSAGYFNDIILQNNSIQKAYVGIYAIATVATGNGSGLLITGNDLSASGTNAIRYIGVYVQGVDGATVSSNTIGNFGTASDEYDRGIWFATGTVNSTISGNTIFTLNYSGTSNYAPRGICLSSGTSGSGLIISHNTISGLTSSGTGTTMGVYLGGATSGVTISNNNISNIKNTNSSGYSAEGITLTSSSTTANTGVSNNFISDVTGYGYSSATTDNGYGIDILSGGGYNIYYNSINLATNQTSSTGIPACLIINSSVATVSCLDIRNNIFSIPATVGTNRYAVLCNATNTVFSYMDYNDYYTNGSNLGYIGATNRSNLAAWKTGTGKDVYSISVLPTFTTSTNLHLTSSVGTAVIGTGITTDIDGDTRSGSVPWIGADEMAAIPSCTTLSSPTPSGITNVCINENLNWTAVSGATGYILYFGTNTPPTNIVNGTNLGNVITYSPGSLATNTTYYWKIVPTNSFGDATGCSIWSFTTGIDGVPNAPTDLTASPAIVCDGFSSYLTASNGSNGIGLQWYTGSCGGTSAGTGYITVTPSSSTTYYVASTNRCGIGPCSNINITVNPNPNPPTSVSGTNYCSGNSGTLTGTPPSGCTINWYTGGCDQNYVGQGNSLLVSGIQTGASSVGWPYYAQSINTTTGCVSASCTETSESVFIYGTPSIVSNPSNQVCGQTWTSGNGHYFTVGTAGDATTFQWQYSPDNTNWSNISTDTPTGVSYTGGTTNYLTLAGSGVALGTYYYRCIVGSSHCTSSSATSNSAILYVTSNTIWYSRTNGNWSTTSTWSHSDCSGGAASTGYPHISSDIVYICSGKTVTITANDSVFSIYNNGTLTINSGVTFTNKGTFNNFYLVNINGTFTNASGGVYNEEYQTTIGNSAAGIFNNNLGAICNIVESTSYKGNILVGVSSSNAGTFNNNGTLNIFSKLTDYSIFRVYYGQLKNENTGIINNSGGSTTSSGIYIAGNSYNKGTINTNYKCYIVSGYTFDNYGTFTNNGWNSIYGTFNNRANSTYNENCETDISGGSSNSATFHNYSGATTNGLENGLFVIHNSYSSLINNSGGILTNHAVCYDGVINYSGGTIINNGTYNNNGTINNNGNLIIGETDSNAVFNHYMSSGSITGDGHYFTYGNKAQLNYLGNSDHITQLTSDYELPSTNYPYSITINNDYGVKLHANKTIGSPTATTSLTLKSGAFDLNMHKLTIDNPSTSAILRDGSTNTGYMVSEDERSLLQWNIGTANGTYTYPFGRFSGNLYYVPFIFKKNSGTGTGNVSVTTYHSSNDNLPLPQAVYNIVGGGQLNDAGNILDRWWVITPSSYSAINADVTFNYEYTDASDNEFTTPNTISETDLQAQHWNGTSWDVPTGTVNTSNHNVMVTGITSFSPWTLVNKKVPLPVEFLNFSINCENNIIVLKWSTLTETNNNYFTIERSMDARTWKDIASVSGSGNSNNVRNYQYSDVTPLPDTSYYRIKQTDFNGLSKTYEPKFADCQNIIDPHIEYYPNPFRSEVYIGIKNLHYNKAKVIVWDMFGKIVLNQTLLFNEDIDVIKLDLESLADGLYTIRFSADDYVNIQKIIKK